ncbi:surfeit locus protein 2-like isoform X2 [Neltuma alba]|uniref:surfeit locus protein 2-like isoform X2 n=1 Tax=Neltuma alba TaxID=207710 RepID=UPI0010A371EB|nr:surfeit locus protein 2-like isoform X2 [Prosopis alba]XP_028772418.1 surfeit locus protein 2-like isoform X2 [Prosopis alba]
MAMAEEKAGKEGFELLGSPTFNELENGRFRCVETGHELFAKDMDSYSHSKKCRLGLIDFALSHNKPPCNMFKQDPLSRSKLICKLTGDTVNKSEEHIWKHMNGKRFLNKLEQKEAEKLSCDGMEEEESKPRPLSADGGKTDKKKKKKKEDKDIEDIKPEVRKSSNEDSDSEEAEFWMPPVGDRWDFDDGRDRWGSGTESEQESEEANEIDGNSKDSEELSSRTKRMSIEIGPSSFASRKKKSKKDLQS